MLADVREALGDEVVGGDLERSGRRPSISTFSRTGTGARAASCSSATASPCPLTTAGWMPARDLAQLLERGRDLAPRLTEPRARIRVAVQLLFEQAQLERERDQPLLRAVVQVALEPLALLLTSVDDPRARALELFQASSQLGVQPGVLECDAGRRADRVEQLGLVTQRRVVQQRRHAHPVSVDQRRRSPAVIARQLHRPAVEVGVASNSGSQ